MPQQGNVLEQLQAIQGEPDSPEAISHFGTEVGRLIAELRNSNTSVSPDRSRKRTGLIAKLITLEPEKAQLPPDTLKAKQSALLTIQELVTQDSQSPSQRPHPHKIATPKPQDFPSAPPDMEDGIATMIIDPSLPQSPPEHSPSDNPEATINWKENPPTTPSHAAATITEPPPPITAPPISLQMDRRDVEAWLDSPNTGTRTRIQAATPARPSGRIVHNTTRFQTPKEGDIFARKYRIIDKLGQGGCGIAFLVENLKLKRNEVLKILLAEEGAAIRLGEEARASAKCNDPNLCKVHTLEDDNSEYPPYMTMEIIEGEDLKEKIEREGPPKTEEQMTTAITIIAQIAKGLSKPHGVGLFHRDVKPENIRVTPDGKAVLIDFGIAKSHDELQAPEQEGAIAGTGAYMPWEQVQGFSSRISAASDAYALGITFVKWMTGRVVTAFPYLSANVLLKKISEVPQDIWREEIRDCADYNIPEPIKEFLDGILHKFPEDRYVKNQDGEKEPVTTALQLANALSIILVDMGAEPITQSGKDYQKLKIADELLRKAKMYREALLASIEEKGIYGILVGNGQAKALRDLARKKLIEGKLNNSLEYIIEAMETSKIVLEKSKQPIGNGEKYLDEDRKGRISRTNMELKSNLHYIQARVMIQSRDFDSAIETLQAGIELCTQFLEGNEEDRLFNPNRDALTEIQAWHALAQGRRSQQEDDSSTATTHFQTAIQICQQALTAAHSKTGTTVSLQEDDDEQVHRYNRLRTLLIDINHHIPIEHQITTEEIPTEQVYTPPQTQ
jgi:tetratricopeptide (TPR) repeat protein